MSKTADMDVLAEVLRLIESTLKVPADQVDVDQLMKSQMEKIVPSYDSYMRKMTLGRERSLREMTVRDLLGVVERAVAARVSESANP